MLFIRQVLELQKITFKLGCLLNHNKNPVIENQGSQFNYTPQPFTMKFILILFLPLLVTSASYGQVITYDEFKSVIPFLQKEDFKGAFDKTIKLLSNTQNDSSDLRGIVTYMNIFSAAGMVTLDQMTHTEFLKNANQDCI